MTNKSIKCVQCYSFGQTYLFVAQSVKAILPLRAYYAKTALAWHLGEIEWDGIKVPVINLSKSEALNDTLPHSHMMIIQCLGGTSQTYVAIVIAQIARPIDISEQSLEFNGEPCGFAYPVKGSLMMGEIVDLKQLSIELRAHHIMN